MKKMICKILSAVMILSTMMVPSVSQYTFRELHSPVLMFHHPELDKASLAGNIIGGHMNILCFLFIIS